MDPWVEVEAGDMQRMAESAYLFRRSRTKPWGFLATQPNFHLEAKPDTKFECWATSTDRVDWHCPSMTMAEFDSLEQDMVGGEVDEGGEGGAAEAPTNVDVPHVSQDGATLNCTMGNWTGEPTEYHYVWNVEGNDVGEDSSTYPITVEDAGLRAFCVVTAVNAAGSTEAPPSNELTIGEPVGARDNEQGGFRGRE